MWYKTLTGILTLLIFLNSCTTASIDHLAHIASEDVRSILRTTYEISGGIDHYLSIDSVIYDKRTVLYHPDGSVESEVRQHHVYQLRPSLTGLITWSDSIGHHSIVYNGDASYKTLNGAKVANSEQSATQSFMSSYYVLFLPFKLIDPGVELTYEGTTMIDHLKCDMIKAVYQPDKHDNHSTSDQWTFFINQEDGSVISHLVYHHPTYAYIENTEFNDQHLLRMNTYRQSWRTDENRRKEYLRGEFWYSNYKFTHH